MPQPHLIRLRGPWQLTPLARHYRLPDGTSKATSDGLPQGGTLQMPADWSALLGPEFAGRVRHQRRFHRPTGLGSGEHVWLVCEGIHDSATIELNGQRIGSIDAGSRNDLCDPRLGSVLLLKPQVSSLRPSASGRFDVTERLLAFNELSIDVEFASDGELTGRCGGLVGEIRLEIVA